MAESTRQPQVGDLWRDKQHAKMRVMRVLSVTETHVVVVPPEAYALERGVQQRLLRARFVKRFEFVKGGE